MTKFWNMIGYNLPHLSSNRMVYASCLLLDSVNSTVKGTVKHHAYVSGQNASCALAVVLHFAEVTDVVVFFFMNTYNRCLVPSQILS